MAPVPASKLPATVLLGACTVLLLSVSQGVSPVDAANIPESTPPPSSSRFT